MSNLNDRWGSYSRRSPLTATIVITIIVIGGTIIFIGIGIKQLMEILAAIGQDTFVGMEGLFLMREEREGR